MSSTENNSEQPKSSSRRRRWEVKSKDSFQGSLAMEVNYPNQGKENIGYEKDRNNLAGKERPKTLKRDYSSQCKEEVKEIPDDKKNSDTVSTKLSALLNDAAEITEDETKRIYHTLRDSEESLVKSELKAYNINELNTNTCEPTAPPISPRNMNSPSKEIESDELQSNHSVINVIKSDVTQHTKHIKDLIKEGKTNTELGHIPTFAVSGLVIGPSSSAFNGNISTIYCEKLNNFVISSDKHVLNTHKNEPLRDLSKKETMKSYALFLQTGFRTFSIFCQGLLSGILTAHCLMIFFLAHDNEFFLKKKSHEHIFFCLIFFLLCICLVSSFERNDVAGQGVFSEHGIKIPWTIMLYLISFILTLIMIRAEDYITHIDIYSQDHHLKVGDIMTWWKYMCLARTLTAILAWVTLVADPHTDAFRSHIEELMDD